MLRFFGFALHTLEFCVGIHGDFALFGVIGVLPAGFDCGVAFALGNAKSVAVAAAASDSERRDGLAAGGLPVSCLVEQQALCLDCGDDIELPCQAGEQVGVGFLCLVDVVYQLAGDFRPDSWQQDVLAGDGGHDLADGLAVLRPLCSGKCRSSDAHRSLEGAQRRECDPKIVNVMGN